MPSSIALTRSAPSQLFSAFNDVWDFAIKLFDVELSQESVHTGDALAGIL